MSSNLCEEIPAQTSDADCVPDPSVSIEEMHAYGYTYSGMLPLSKKRALELFKRDMPVYMLYDDNSEAMALKVKDIARFTGYFGISCEDWDAVKDKLLPTGSKRVHKKRETVQSDESAPQTQGET